ncbi:hypothetical protein [Streptomyces echinatus]|uniref:Uncharacterized protein n=1 Tax=Streptomyces echinatus TaxID=67293 RepID=A0A7W9PY49_9ACTN|nr:hypothetical protein [Streptomyces echinatus]MBB5929337.1 hypothetical protein [Streptomyces echinatus]
MKKFARTTLILISAWTFWGILFFAPIPFLPTTSFLGLITAFFTFFALPAFALKETKEWREGGASRGAKSAIPRHLIGFSRHVDLLKDGRGVTYQVAKGPHGPRFTWRFDPGVPANDLMITVLVQEELGRIENELGLPVTFPHATPEGREAARQRAEASRPSVEQLREAAADGDARALERLWSKTGKPITDAAQLKAGTYYHLGYDIGRYVRSFEGRMWEGTEFDDLNDEENGYGTWHVFATAETTRSEGSRVSTEQIRTSAAGGDPDVRLIPASQDEAVRVFEELHVAYVAWDARRKSH